jgi:hypothetical protein
MKVKGSLAIGFERRGEERRGEDPFAGILPALSGFHGASFGGKVACLLRGLLAQP